jgi:hypothetical protein
MDGQQRSQWLAGIDNRLSGVARYYLGPTGIDRRLNALAGLAPLAMNGTDYIDAQAGAQNFLANPSLPNALAFATPMVALAMPGVSARMAEGVADVGGDLARFATDDSGALRLFHGSPHDFDKFSMDKIGTGEGAQAYGHGLYFAEKEAVAQGYQTNNSATAALRYDGKPITDETKKSVAWYLEQNDGNKEAVIEQWRAMYKPSYFDSPLGRREMRALEKMDPAKLKAGNMYEVEVNANPEDFLDWDAPLSAQPERVRGALTSIKMRENQTPDGPGPVGADLRRMYNNPRYTPTSWAAETPSDVTRTIKDAGIPGIRYLDAGSRNAGDGSRNYVVFDENLISIVRKYGIAGAAAILGMSQADVASAAGMDAATGQPMAQRPPRQD